MERNYYRLLVITFMYLQKSFADPCKGLRPVISPPKLMVQYGDAVRVHCTASSTAQNSSEFQGLGWEAKQGDNNGLQENQHRVEWNVSSMTEWEEENIKCFTTLRGLQCNSTLPITIYKPPDRVSLRMVNSSGGSAMVEGTKYQLECEVQNVAPLKNLRVKWLRGTALLNESDHTQLSSSDDPSKNVTVTARLQVLSSRADNGVHYWCEAELDLLDLPGRLKYLSNNLTMTVHCKDDISCSEPDDLLPFIAGGVAIGLIILTGIGIAVFCLCYRKSRMGFYILKNFSVRRNNTHVAQSNQSQQSEL